MTRGLLRLDPRSLFLIVSVAAGLPMVFLVPPFQSPDEPAHLFRAWALAEGRVFAEIRSDASGSELPASLLELQLMTMGPAPTQPPRKLDAEDLRRAWGLRTSQDRRVLPYTTAAALAPLVYLPQALGIALARPFERPLLALYAGRFANLAVGLLLAWLALTLAPRGRWIFFAVALLPMAVFLRSSLSPDVVTMGLAWLAIAATLRLEVDPDPSWVTGLPLLAFLLATAKLAYTPLALPAAVVSWSRSRPRALAILAGATLGVVVSLPWSQAWQPIRSDTETSPALQLRAMADDPLLAALTVAADPVLRAPRYAAEMIGRLGWLDVGLPVGYLVLTALLVLAVALREPRAGSWRLRGSLAAAAALSALLVTLAQYLAWTPVGAGFVEGVSGRYFLPLAPAALIALSPGTREGEGVMPWLIASWAMGSAAMVSIVVWGSYWR